MKSESHIALTQRLAASERRNNGALVSGFAAEVSKPPAQPARVLSIANRFAVVQGQKVLNWTRNEASAQAIASGINDGIRRKATARIILPSLAGEDL